MNWGRLIGFAADDGPRLRHLLARCRFALGPTLVSVLASGLSATATLLIAREIGAVEFGGYTIVVTVAGILLIAVLLSLNFVMYQELPRTPVDQHPIMISTALWSTLVLGIVVVAATALAIPLLTAVLGVDTGTVWHAVGVSLAMSANAVTESFLRGKKRFARVAGLKLVVAMTHVVVAAYLLFVLGVRDFETYTVLLMATNVVFSALALIGLDIRLVHFSVRRAVSMYRHGAWVSLTSALMALAFGLDVIIMNRFYPQDVVGAFSIYNGFPKRLLGIVFTEGIGLVLLPTLATLHKPALLRAIGRMAPLVGLAAAVPSFAASAAFLAVLRSDYPYSLPLMALASVGIGVHTVFNLYFFALSMDGTRGARVVVACIAAALLPVLAGQVVLIKAFGLAGGLVAFTSTNAILIGVIVFGSAHIYREPAAIAVHETDPIGAHGTGKRSSS